MGFKDLECFNKVLLAKQFWSLVIQPYSLVANIFREKYCKDGLFLEAKTKGHHSMIQKSILTTKATLKASLRWKVGNGENINIWGDKWLLTSTSFAIQSPPEILNGVATVSELILVDGKE